MADYLDVLVFLVGRVLPLLSMIFLGAPQFKRNFMELWSDTWTLKVYKILMSKDKCEHTKVSGQFLCFVLF